MGFACLAISILPQPVLGSFVLQLPSLFELNRALLADIRVHSLLVLPPDPVDDRIFYRAHRNEPLDVQPFDLERPEKRLDHRVVPTVGLAAHKRNQAVHLH